MNIYVGNLSYNVTEDSLRSMFEAFGGVVSAKLIMDRDTGQSKGFGFVEMECKYIDGMNESQSYEFLSQLLELVTGENQIYRHQWSVGDLLVWDNRCMMHTPTEYNYATQRRRLHRVIGLQPD